MVDIKRLLYEKFLKQIMQQTKDGTPIEGVGFFEQPLDGQAMPTIEHQHGKKRPQWLEDELGLDGWEPLQ